LEHETVIASEAKQSISPHEGRMYFALSPVNGSFATVAAQIPLRKLDASTAASGPHVYILVFGETRRN